MRYDAIVIGSGISGGWAAKELCEKGLKTLVLERGRNIEHIKDYPGYANDPWDYTHRGQLSRAQLKENPLISKAAGYAEDTAHFFVKDADHPYVQEKPFDWIRGYQVGGKSLTWGRSCQRWSDFEFNGPKENGYAVDWPIRYKDIAPWYSHVEKFSGICGTAENIPSMPDGEFLPGYEFNCVEQHLRDSIKKNFNRHYITGRWAHLSEPAPIHREQGRGQCQNRNLCMRGCPFGGYFSSVTATLPWAIKTGNLTIRPYSVVHSVLYDEKTGKASGVRVIDAVSKETIDFEARIIFVNASALNTNLILLNSTSSRFPNGLGNDSGVLGKYICFHNYRGSMGGIMPGFEDKYYEVRKPVESVIPNFRNLGKQDTDFLGGYVIFSGAGRGRGSAAIPGQTEGDEGIGASLKKSLSEPGPWWVYMYMQGETIPKETNHVRLHEEKKDQWGIPLLVTSVGYDDNDDRMVKDFLEQGEAMLKAAGVINIRTLDTHQPPGLDIHEMGGVRMGLDPKTSMLNAFNQVHGCPNVFVTDGACMTSTGNQSPSILYMAFTARAVDHAVNEMKKGDL
ncbi:GMC oxidoreductase [Flavihumibacter petaseus]|uniref:Putative oxidoreductase n=1 Tax=Flavihumibacter petaseus NBRC 106054 TaxID=1220578 RepID=A0A0E9N084_9BACT|nr:GMC family oxidoreductase [Flavihumibacter petaseus]GAO42780.1 putative oxidoreductase [Flavihumibacter petaseus NBRC 106054]